MKKYLALLFLVHFSWGGTCDIAIDFYKTARYYFSMNQIFRLDSIQFNHKLDTFKLNIGFKFLKDHDSLNIYKTTENQTYLNFKINPITNTKWTLCELPNPSADCSDIFLIDTLIYNNGKIFYEYRVGEDTSKPYYFYTYGDTSFRGTPHYKIKFIRNNSDYFVQAPDGSNHLICNENGSKCSCKSPTSVEFDEFEIYNNLVKVWIYKLPNEKLEDTTEYFYNNQTTSTLRSNRMDLKSFTQQTDFISPNGILLKNSKPFLFKIPIKNK